MGSNLLIECTLFLHFIPISLVFFIPWMVWNLAFLQFNCCKILQISWQELLFTINYFLGLLSGFWKMIDIFLKPKMESFKTVPKSWKKPTFELFWKKINYFFLLKIIIFLLFLMIFVFFLHFWIKHNLMVNKLYCIQSIG